MACRTAGSGRKKKKKSTIEVDATSGAGWFVSGSGVGSGLKKIKKDWILYFKIYIFIKL